MIELLRDSNVIQFILEHENDDVAGLALQHQDIFGIPFRTIADQIKGRQKAKQKIPEFYNNPNTIYPPSENLEQSSSETTARFKYDFVYNLFGKKMSGIGADLTGGFGVDSYFMSAAFREWRFVEQNVDLLEITKANFETLRRDNVIYYRSSAENFLNSLDNPIDFIYIDPSRRSEKKKVITLSDSLPDLTTLKHLIFKKTNFLLVKTSPLLDIQKGINDLSFVKQVIVLSVQNECRELLFLCEHLWDDEPEILAVNILKDGQEEFAFRFSRERTVVSSCAEAGDYLYEPNASILKSGAFKSIAEVFDLKKLETNTHVYTSQDLKRNFPGRIFKRIAGAKADPKELRQLVPEGNANIITRNYPLSPEELKKKLKLNDGGEKYVIGVTDVSGKKLIIAERLK